MRKRYLISYDISDDKRRNAVFKLLSDNGDHVQFSVFFADLNAVELIRLKAGLEEPLNQRQDQIIILDLGPADADITTRLECLGQPYNPPARVQVI